MTKLTLAQQLAQIAQPAPQDFDPEDAYATYADHRPDPSGAADDADTGAPAIDSAAVARADYVQVGTSKLRKRGEAVLDAKYEGKKGSRAALYGDDDKEEDEEDEDEDEDEDEGDDSQVGQELASDFEDGDEDEDEDEDDEDGEDGEEDEEVNPSSTQRRAAVPKPKSQDERAMVKQLKQAASADVEKGRDVKKQLGFCDSLLEARIQLQKAVGAANLLPTPAQGAAETFFARVPAELDAAREEVEALHEELFTLRETLMTTNEKIELPAELGAASRKRKRTSSAAADHAAYLDTMLADLATLEQAFDPFLRSTVSKWSDKVLAASGLALNKDKKFKAVHQNALTQIDHALSGAGERDRLVRRTRIRRGEGEVIGARRAGAASAAGEAGAAAEGDATEASRQAIGGTAAKGTGAQPVDEECFDDSDFYQQLLRDVVESRMLDLDDATMTQLRHATAMARGKKVKKVVDTRASKGRKIRYHVHEKVQNFMIPIEAGDWHEQQVDELFASLLGRSFPPPASQEHEPAAAMDPALDDSAAPEGQAVEVGSLRLLG